MNYSILQVSCTHQLVRPQKKPTKVQEQYAQLADVWWAGKEVHGSARQLGRISLPRDRRLDASKEQKPCNEGRLLAQPGSGGTLQGCCQAGPCLCRNRDADLHRAAASGGAFSCQVSLQTHIMAGAEDLCTTRVDDSAVETGTEAGIRSPLARLHDACT